jgi:hypothetical protein
MANKHIKLFEQHSEEYETEKELLNSIFEDWKLDQDDFDSLYEYELGDVHEGEDEEDWMDDDSELTSGERAALSRDFQILSKAQMAALFLRALGKEEDNDPGKYLVMINGILPFGQIDENSGVFNITIPALADAIGLESTRTVSRTVRKFINLLSGAGETPGEAIYPKLEKAFVEFNQRTPREVALLASEAIQDPAAFTKNRDAAEAAGPRAAADRMRRKAEQLNMGEKVHSLVKSLKNVDIFRAPGKAEKAAISKLANELGLTPDRVALAYNKFLSDKGIN